MFKLQENEFKFSTVESLRDESEKKAMAAALKAGQSSARTRTLDVDESAKILSEMVKKLDSVVPKTYQTGAAVSYIEGADQFPRAYKYEPMGTQLKIVKHSTFYLASVSRENCNRETYPQFYLDYWRCKKRKQIELHIKKAMCKMFENHFDLNVTEDNR